MNNKFSIGVVIAIVLQVSAFVWWTAQQAQTIETLKAEVETLTSEMTIARQINKERDLEDMKEILATHEQWITENYEDIEALIDFAKFTENRWANEYTSDNTYQRHWGTKAPE